MLSYTGKLEAIREKEFQGETTKYLQFLSHDDLSGGIVLTDIKCTNAEVLKTAKVGEEVNIPVKVSTMNGNIYYRCD